MHTQLLLKRLFDIFLSVSLLIILSPILLIIICCIKIDTVGPILFKQARLGKAGKVFNILKFRTMIPNAEQVGTGIVVSEAKDQRITSVGRRLRATSLDELPQLLNVLKGEMSLVGPRPPVVYHPYDGYLNYPTWAKERFEMRPGITGLAQLSVRNSVPWDERMKFDANYIHQFSFLLDIRILLMTAIQLFRPKNIYIHKG